MLRARGTSLRRNMAGESAAPSKDERPVFAELPLALASRCGLAGRPVLAGRCGLAGRPVRRGKARRVRSAKQGRAGSIALQVGHVMHRVLEILRRVNRLAFPFFRPPVAASGFCANRPRQPGQVRQAA